MCLVAGLLYLAVTIMQFLAIVGGLDVWLGLPLFLAIILALIVAWIPLVGTVLGIAGAMTAWGWEWYWALLLMFFPMVVSAAIALITGTPMRRHRL